jgi:hypothetical protein
MYTAYRARYCTSTKNRDCTSMFAARKGDSSYKNISFRSNFSLQPDFCCKQKHQNRKAEKKLTSTKQILSTITIYIAVSTTAIQLARYNNIQGLLPISFSTVTV